MALSYSQISTYRRCPKQYEFAYVKKVPRAISAGESFGSSMHNTLKRWGELELNQQGSTIPREHQLTLFIDKHDAPRERLDLTTLLNLWNDCFIAQGYGGTSDMDAAFQRGKQSLERFFDWWKRERRTVISIEQSFKIMVRSSTAASYLSIVSGRLDRIEKSSNGQLTVIDYKTSQPRLQTEVDDDLQLSLYALACEELYGKLPRDLMLLFIGSEEIVERRTTRTPEQLHTARELVASIGTCIELADFAATPTSEKCRSCPYREMCPEQM